MKNGILIMLLVLGACSSERHSHDVTHDVTHDITPESPKEMLMIEYNPLGEWGWGFNLITDGNCEYIMYTNHSNKTGLTHKGDCSNPIHPYNLSTE